MDADQDGYPDYDNELQKCRDFLSDFQASAHGYWDDKWFVRHGRSDICRRALEFRILGCSGKECNQCTTRGKFV